MMMLDGTKKAASLYLSLRRQVRTLAKKKIQPGVGILLIGDNPASVMYVSRKEKSARELGMLCTVVKLKKEAGEQAAKSALRSLNRNRAFHGIMVQLPLPSHLQLERIISEIDPEKDIDCLHPVMLAKLLRGEKNIFAPTAQAVCSLLNDAEPNVKGKDVVVVGAGFFGRQIALTLLNNNATVTLAHEYTRELYLLTRKADIVVTAVGKAHVFGKTFFGGHSIIIDVGVSKKNGGVVGDVEYATVAPHVRALTPVPGGVGPLTVAYLMSNVVHAAWRQRDV